MGLRAAEFLLVTTFRPDISQIELYNRIKNLENSDSQLTGQIQSFQNQLEKLEGELQNATYSVDLTKLYSRTAKSVVLIENRVMIRGTLFAQSLGSGFVYSADGYVVTNNHVVQGASELVVTFLDGNASKATVVGTDHYSDLAVVKLEARPAGLVPLPLGNSSALRVGEAVVAMGSPFGLDNTMTSGIISQVGRELDEGGSYKIVDVIQHDVPINPGNSGTYSGVGFAIPSDTIAREVPELIAMGTYKHPYLGVSGVEVDLDIAQAASLNFSRGFLITDVVSGGPADTADVRGGSTNKIVLGQVIRIGGDVITAVDGSRVLHLDDLFVYLERFKRPSENVTLTLVRSGVKLTKTVLLGERPSL